ncbi:unnamed protein product [Discula destructiva]
MASDPLGPQNILQAMANALPTHEKGDTSSDMSSSAESIALFTHACVHNLGFRLLGFNEDQKIESACARLAPRLPAKWNASVSSYSFLYAHTQSSMHFVIKVDRLGAKIEIRGLAVGADKINRLELSARDYISPAALPLRITLRRPSDDNGQATTTTETEEEDRSDLVSKLQAVFVSPERIASLASLFKINIIQRLIPSLQKDGYQENPDDLAAQADANRTGREGPARQPSGRVPPGQLPEPANPYPFDDPLAAHRPRRGPPPLPGDFPPPEFEDEFEIHQPGRLQRPGTGGVPSFGGIGHSDLYPPGLGPQDPLRQSFVPGGPSSPWAGGRAGGPMGGGMHPTFDDPLFQGPRGGVGEGEGYDFQAPPGARWDPVGPGVRGPRFGGGRPGGDDGFGPSGFGPGGFGGGGIL